MTPAARRAAWMAIVAVALALRLLPSWSAVFTPGFVNLQDLDAWYHLRLIEYQVRHFPHRLLTDPYLADGGALVAVAPFFDTMVATLAWAFGGRDASTFLIAAVAAFVPPILGLVTVVVTGRIGRDLFGVGTGMLASALVAVMPGHFLDRTRLGFVDHHAAESALAMVTLWCLMMASRGALHPLMTRETWSRQGVFALLAGLGWGAYLATWTSGALLSFILAAWMVLHAVLAIARSASASPVPRVVALASVVAAAVLVGAEPITAWRFGPRLMSVVIAGGAAVGVVIVQALGRRFGPAPGVIGVVMAGIVVAGAIGLVRFGDAIRILFVDVQRLLPGPAASTVGEVRPLLLLLGAPSLLPAWALFGAPFFLGVPGLAWLAWRVVQRARPDASLLLVFGTSVLIATLGQNRFGYYLVPVLALITGWLCAAGLRASRQGDGPTVGWRTLVPAGAVGAVVFAPLLQPALATAGQATGLSLEWRGALTFLREATPDPFDGRPVVTEAHHGAVGLTDRPAYTVLAWWDLGYPLIQIARRVPVAVPTQAGAGHVSWFLGATDPGQAIRLLRASRSRYLVLSEDLLLLPVTAESTRLQGRFESVMAWGPGAVTGYYEPFLERDSSGVLREVVLFHPRYYESMAARLFLFGGRAVEPRDSTWVITWRVGMGPDGRRGKEVMASRGFATFEEADRYRQGLGNGPHELVGRDPTRTCVPLGSMPEFRPVFETDDGSVRPSGRPSVRVFEFVDSLTLGQ